MNIASNFRTSIFAGLVAVLATTSAAFSKGASPVPGKPGDATIVEIAAAVNAETGEFDYLLAAVGCLTGDDGTNPVVSLLTGSDAYTLFAPTDSAFMALQSALGVAEGAIAPEVTCTLGNETVFDVLAYHVTEGRRFSNSVFNKRNTKLIEMLNGQYITTNPGLTIDSIGAADVGIALDEDGQPVANINASNGVIHVIDAVLLPFSP